MKVELRILLEDSLEKAELLEVKVESSGANVEAIHRKVEVSPIRKYSMKKRIIKYSELCLKLNKQPKLHTKP